MKEPEKTVVRLSKTTSQTLKYSETNGYFDKIQAFTEGKMNEKINVSILAVCLLTVSFTIMATEKASSHVIAFVYAGEDQEVYEGEVVQFNGTAMYLVTYPVWPVDVSGNGQYLAIGWDKNVTFFSTASNIPIWTYNTGGEGRVGDVKLSEDGRFLVAGSYRSVFFFNTTSSTPLWSVTPGGPTIRYDGDPGNRLDMTRDGKYIAAAAEGNRVVVYDTTSSTPTVPYWDYTFGGEMSIVRFSREGNHLSMGAKNGKLKLGWVPTRSINWTASPGDVVYSSSLSYNGGRISCGKGVWHQVHLYDSGSPTPLWTHTLMGRQLEQVMSDDGNYLASGNHWDDHSGTWSGFAFWNTPSSTPVWTYSTGTGASSNADAIDMDINANFVVGGSRTNSVYLFSQLSDNVSGWSSSDGNPIFTYDTGGVINYNGISMDYNGTYFAAGSFVGGVFLFSTVNSPHLEWTWFTDTLFPVIDPENYKWDFNNYVDSDLDGNFINDIDATGPTPTHIYGDDGVYTVALNVSDDTGSSMTDTMLVTVNNLAPSIEPFGPFIVDEYAPFVITGNATDTGSDDLTFTWSWGDFTTDTISIYYNDGMGSDPYPSPEGTFPFYSSDSVQHIYEDEGVYIINLTAEDDDGGVTFYTTTVIVNNIPILPPILYINVSEDGEDGVLYWDPPPVPDLNHYLIYRSTSQVDFDFNTVWIDTSKDVGEGEVSSIPLRTIWIDTKAAQPGDLNYKEQYYYIIRAVNDDEDVSSTSRTVGKWTTTFSKGVSTFSLPLEPLETMNRSVDYYLKDMNAGYIKWMNLTTHAWMKHGDDGVNNTYMKVGEGYEVRFDSQSTYTFTGMPGAMISYDDDNGFLGFDPATEARNLSVTIEPGGNVTLTWQEPGGMGPGDWYEVYYSNERDGFFKTLGVNYSFVCPLVYFGNNTATHINVQANNPGARLYYMVVPFNAHGVRGASTYSIGIWTEEYLSQYDTFGIPLKMNNNHTADWYCDNIPDTVGINYYNISAQRWSWHSTRMASEAYDPLLVMTEGYQISTSQATKYTFIGI